MAGLYHFCCLILTAICSTSAQEHAPLCNPNDFTTNPNHPLPDFPDQFSVTIERVTGGYVNFTQISSEYYDSPGNRARIDTRYGLENKTDSTIIFDYNLQEVFVFPDLDTGDECRVYNITNSPIVNLTFGVENRNSTLHIGSPVRFLEGIFPGTAIRFQGMNKVRGIPVMHWQACTFLLSSSYFANYYFAPRSYDYNGESAKLTDDNELVPIQFELFSSGSSAMNFTATYNFIDFKSGPDSVSDEMFSVPLGLRCKGRMPGTPPKIPDFFSMTVEYMGDYAQRVDTFRVSGLVIYCT